MASLPYITSPGNIAKTFNAIKAAPVPPKVNQDFVKDILKIPGGSGDQITAFLKKIGFSNSDATPTELYTTFRNPSYSGKAIATAIKFGYAPLYKRKEYMHELNDDDLLGLVVEETGLPHDSNPVKLTVTCIKNLKELADFSFEPTKTEQHFDDVMQASPKVSNDQYNNNGTVAQKTGVGLNLGYTININLPATTDQAVFNSIFKAIKQNLLSDDDA